MSRIETHFLDGCVMAKNGELCCSLNAETEFASEDSDTHIGFSSRESNMLVVPENEVVMNIFSQE